MYTIDSIIAVSASQRSAERNDSNVICDEPVPRQVRSSLLSESPSRTPVEGIGDVGKGLGKGGQVPVIHTPGIQSGGELGQRSWPFRALGDSGDGHFLNDGDQPVDLDDPVDDLDGGAPGSGRAGELPGPMAT